MCARHLPAHAEAQCCFKSFALRSCQCGRKTQYGLEFWSLDLASAGVHFLGESQHYCHVTNPLLFVCAGQSYEVKLKKLGNLSEFQGKYLKVGICYRLAAQVSNRPTTTIIVKPKLSSA